MRFSLGAAFAFLALLFAVPAFSQSSATPTVPGTLQSGICPYAGQTTCYVPGTPLSPLQVFDTTFASVGSPGTLSATTTTSNLALPANGSIVEIANGGSVPVYVNLGVGSGTTATLSSMMIPKGQTAFLAVGSNTYIAGITGSSTASVTVTVGNLAAISGGGGGGNVTITAPLGTQTGANSVAVICNSGCSGGGGAVYGPTAVGSTVANPPVMQGFQTVGGNVAIVTPSVGLPVNIVSGGSTGATSNASSGVATSSTNTPTVSYIYGFNGTTWDQLQDDSNKWLKGDNYGWAGTALGAPSNYGTPPGAVEVPGVNAFITNTPAVTCSACSTSANQSTEITSLATIAAGTSVSTTSPCASNITASCTITAEVQLLDQTAAAAVPLEALSAEPTAATTGNPTPAWGDLYGKLVTSPYAPRNLFVGGAATITGTGATTLLAAQGSGVKIYVTDLVCTRSDTGTTAITGTLNDVNTTLIDIPNTGGGGGFEEHDLVPLQVAANTAFTITMSASVSSSHCHFRGYTGG
jgi:hypothetical protein